MPKPLLIIVNGFPGSGKTTLAIRLSRELRLPIFSRDAIYETLYDALSPDFDLIPPSLGVAAFRMLFFSLGGVLAARQSVIVEGFFGRSDLLTEQFSELHHQHDFESLQILCNADGAVLLERFLARAGSSSRHRAHADPDWLEQNRERLLSGELLPMALGSEVIKVDTTAQDRLNYDALLAQVRILLS